MEYMISETLKAEVAKADNGYEVKFYESYRTASGDTKWYFLIKESWASLDDFKAEYGI